MAEQPVTFKKKRTKRSQRAREQDVDAEPTSEATADTGEESPSTLATQLKNKLKTRNKPKSRLSFGVDEEVRMLVVLLYYSLSECFSVIL